MQNQQQLETFIINFIESELRALEGDTILNEMEQNALPNPHFLITEEPQKAISIIKKGASLVESMYRNEGLYEAYNRMLKKLLEFKDNQNK